MRAREASAQAVRPDRQAREALVHAQGGARRHEDTKRSKSSDSGSRSAEPALAAVSDGRAVHGHDMHTTDEDDRVAIGGGGEIGDEIDQAVAVLAVLPAQTSLCVFQSAASSTRRSDEDAPR